MTKVLLLVRAADYSAARQAVEGKVDSGKILPFARPFLEAAGVYAFEVAVEDTYQIRDWANCYKDKDRPSLVADFPVG